MAIKAKNTTGVIAVLTVDTVLFTVATGTKICIDAANTFNNSAQDITMDVYISPDNTSASGVKIDSLTIQEQEELDINSITGQAYMGGMRIISKTNIGSANTSITYTLFTDTDA